MDSLSKTVNNLSLWEVKSYVRKAQNAVLNLSDIEAKVREATNNEPWGASTTLMADIARGTFNYRDREEICNMIFRRFTEKSANEWRQIYKSLQLMEYLVKNGSERFVDDARANVSLVSMLKSFHYIDSKGVDQGINIRNRSKELSALLNDESKIRQERKKAKENSKKYDAISSTSAGSRLANKNSTRRNVSSASQSNDGYENRIFGDGGVFGQRFEETSHHQSSNNNFEEYNEDEITENHTRRSAKPTVSTTKTTAAPVSNNAIDLLDDFASPPPAPPAKSINNEDFDDDDEFDDFQSAAPAAAATPAIATAATSTYNAPIATPSAPLAVNSTPAPVDDFFGSLLSSAKTQPSKPINSSSHNQPPYQAPQQASQAPKQAPQSSAIVDLLDL